MMESVCEQAQRAIVSGTLDDAWRDHAVACDECSFFLRLSRSLSGAWPSATEGTSGPLGDALSAALAAACAAREPLLGRWRLDHKLGRGGQAEVYRAVDLDVSETVAVKIVRLPATRDDSAREVALARRVAHRGVCRVFHTERFGELRLIVMELVEGRSLDTVPPPARDRAVAWWRQICEAIAAAHAANVLHLDLKLGNVILRGGDTPVVTDFGLARSAKPGTTARGGTPAFMAPEQLRGDPVDARTDVYALGLIGRYLLGDKAGRWERVIARASANDPHARYSDAGALARELAPKRSKRIAAIAGGVLAVLVLTVAALVALLPPPHGARAMWRPDLWGPDLVTADAWNVALNRSGAGLPQVVAEPASACARRPAELLDGIAQYDSWEHGFAFRAPYAVCIGFDALAPKGLCGTRQPDWKLCHQRAGQPAEALELRVADFDRMSPDDRAKLGDVGELEPPLTCGDRTLTVELDREWPVFAVRQWEHGPNEAPRSFRIEAERAGQWELAYATQQNTEAIKPEMQATGFQGNSAPITSQFPPVTTRRVRITIDTCTMDKSGQGWVYEIEVFSVPSRWRAWWLRIAG